MLLVGSRALLFRAPFLLDRKPRDFDFIGFDDEIYKWMDINKLKESFKNKDKIIVEDNIPMEFEIANECESAKKLISLVEKDKDTINTEFGLIPSLNLLFTLKASHRFVKDSPHFWKTASDYHKMKFIGAEIIPEYQEFFQLRENETYAKQSHPKLDVLKTDFFSGDQIKYIYDHDSIHQSVKFFEKPAYLFYNKEGQEVFSDKIKFFASPKKVQFAGVIEEACVLAIERSLIPYPNKLTPKQAWMLALSKVCSSITSGFFRSFAYDNLFEIIKCYPEDYFSKFESDIKKGIVKKYDE